MAGASIEVIEEARDRYRSTYKDACPRRLRALMHGCSCRRGSDQRRSFILRLPITSCLPLPASFKDGNTLRDVRLRGCERQPGPRSWQSLDHTASEESRGRQIGDEVAEAVLISTGHEAHPWGPRPRHAPMPNDTTRIETIVGRERRRRYEGERAKCGMLGCRA